MATSSSTTTASARPVFGARNASGDELVVVHAGHALDALRGEVPGGADLHRHHFARRESAGVWMLSSPACTTMTWPVAKYGSEKSTACARSLVMVMAGNDDVIMPRQQPGDDAVPRAY